MANALIKSLIIDDYTTQVKASTAASLDRHEHRHDNDGRPETAVPKPDAKTNMAVDMNRTVVNISNIPDNTLDRHEHRHDNDGRPETAVPKPDAKTNMAVDMNRTVVNISNIPDNTEPARNRCAKARCQDKHGRRYEPHCCQYLKHPRQHRTIHA